MDPVRVIEILQQTELFHGVEGDDLCTLVDACPIKELDADELLFEYGQPGSSMFLLLEGRLRVYRGHRTLRILEPNDYLGEMALIDPAPRSASARAIEGPATLFEIPKEAFDQYLMSNPHVLPALVHTLNRRLREVTDATQAAFEEVRMVLHDTLNMLCVHDVAALVMEALPPEDADNRSLLQQLVQVGEEARKTMRKALNKACGMSETYQLEPAQIDRVVRDCLESLAMHRDVKRVPVELVVETPIVPLRCNAIDIKRVVSNLVINAAQAMENGGRITVRLRQDPARTVIEVSDTGPGIPPEILEHIWEPQFTTKETGNGLGLASCREIVEKRHAGKLVCESRVGVGTSFTCELPT